MFGFLAVDKPRGITSHDVVQKIRKQTSFKKIGHTGTLDPFATGVLVISFGGATRLIEYLNEDKGYIADLKFGEVSDTYDIDGKIEKFSDKKVDETLLKASLQKFSGKIIQTPPKYSAICVKGKRLYEYARENKEVEIPKREVEVYCAELLDFDFENRSARIKVKCSKGTYIRSLAYDIGLDTGAGAYLTSLRRIQSGAFLIENSVKLEDVTQNTPLIDPLCVLNLKRHELSAHEYNRVRFGNPIESGQFANNEILLLLYENKIVATAQVRDNLIKVKKVLI